MNSNCSSICQSAEINSVIVPDYSPISINVKTVEFDLLVMAHMS